jgi:L-ascorbate metabolism protein UlaG (beta-lactamase superfamily)
VIQAGNPIPYKEDEMKVFVTSLMILSVILMTPALRADDRGPVLEVQRDSANESIEQMLSSDLGEGEVYVWYLFHCGYAIKTQSKLLIFDYVRGNWIPEIQPANPSLSNGWINPNEIKDRDVYVFTSHSHIDHFDTTIFNWLGVMPEITYFFGWDENTLKQSNRLIGPRASFKNDNIEVHTINSHHSGVPEVAYLIQTDGLVIYHGGDYTGSVSEDIEYLKQKIDHIDVAMLNDHCGDAVMLITEAFLPKVIFPGHNGGKEEELGDIRKCCQDKGLPTVVYCPEHRGESFHLNLPIR